MTFSESGSWRSKMNISFDSKNIFWICRVKVRSYYCKWFREGLQKRLNSFCQCLPSLWVLDKKSHFLRCFAMGCPHSSIECFHVFEGCSSINMINLFSKAIPFTPARTHCLYSFHNVFTSSGEIELLFILALHWSPCSLRVLDSELCTFLQWLPTLVRSNV